MWKPEGNTTCLLAEDENLAAKQYDPLAGEDEWDGDEAAISGGYIGHPEDFAPRSEVQGEELTVQERLRSLFCDMISHKRILITVLETAHEMCTFDEVDAAVDQLVANRRSVYGPEGYVRMLERCGALERVTAEGVPYDQIEIEPVEVERDGQVFLEPSEAPALYIRATPEALEVLDGEAPLEELASIFEEEPQYRHIYRRILELCASPGGASMTSLHAGVNDDPALANPRKFAPFFIDKLDRAGAIEWLDAWSVTEVGVSALAMLQDEGDCVSKGEVC